jgi:phospholipase D1/2
MSFVVDKLKGELKHVEQTLIGKPNYHAHISGEQCSDGDTHHDHRFQSFAPQREGNDAKWYVDGCGYFWAVSIALENAQHEIWILDWWLSPELYLRRPPAQNEHYRLDKMLFAAAQRGVKINVIVYKEVTQALTLSSYHTKHWLEDNDPTKPGPDKVGNIRVFRHPDHLPDSSVLGSSIVSKLMAKRVTRPPGWHVVFHPARENLFAFETC